MDQCIFIDLLPVVPAGKRRLWNTNTSFTYIITFHGVRRILRQAGYSEPKNLRAEPEMLE